MAFTTGTATNYHDLLDKLRLYLVAQGWTQLGWTAPVAITDTATLHMRGPGAGAGRQTFVSIRTYADTTNSIYSWQLLGAVDYDAGAGWGLQSGQSPLPCYLNLWQNSITYWFYVNDRRFVVVAKCSTNYMSAYCGFFLPWGTPAEYPFPLLIAGDYWQRTAFSTNEASRRMCVDPGCTTTSAVGSPDASAYVRSATGIWYPIGNHVTSANNNNAQGWGKGQRAHMWPYQCGYGYSIGLGQHYIFSWNGGGGVNDNANGFESLVPTQQDERPVMPVMPCPGDQAALGVLDGVYAVGGSGLATEQSLTLGARNFKAFQNIARNSADDFFCVEEI